MSELPSQGDSISFTKITKINGKETAVSSDVEQASIWFEHTTSNSAYATYLDHDSSYLF